MAGVEFYISLTVFTFFFFCMVNFIKHFIFTHINHVQFHILARILYYLLDEVTG